MPTAVFPRNDKWKLVGTSKMSVPAARRSITQSGKIQTRTKTTAGRQWTESYPPLFRGDTDVEEFLAWIDWAWNEGKEFSIKHQITPGSGIAPNGAGGGTPQIAGGSQTGTSINTKLWPNNVPNVAMAGDLWRIAGITKSFRVTDNASSNGTGLATVNLNPAIYLGGEAADSAAITRSGVDINAIIQSVNVPDIANSFYYDGLQISFREAP